jgi:two-component system alkaline phosphatase synthesis response regulator PhoP
MARVLVVEDDADIQEITIELLEYAGHSAVGAADVISAQNLLKTESWDVAIMDLVIGDISCLDLIEWVRSFKPGVALVALSGHPQHLETTARMGIPSLHKPFEMSALLTAIDYAMTITPVAKPYGLEGTEAARSLRYPPR